MQKQKENNLCSRFIKSSLSEVFCENCGREEWYHPKENDYKIIFYNEGIKRASQNNFNQAEAGYNAKWFKRGAIFGFKWQQKQIADEFAIEFAEWINKLRDSDIDSLDYAFWLDNTTKELLEIFKKEKGL